MAKGLNMAILLLCFGIGIGMLSGLGYFDVAGSGVQGGVQDDVNEVNESVGGEQTGDNLGDDTLFGMTRSAISTVTVFWNLIVATSTVLQSLGVPEAVADGVQLLVRISFGLFIVQLIRGFIFEQ